MSNLYSALCPPEIAGERTFIRAPDGGALSYGDAWRQTARLAHALVRAGLQPGDRVAVQVDKSATAVLLYLATLRAGGVYVPLNSAYTLHELEYFLDDAAPRIVVCTPQRRRELLPLAERFGAARLLTLGADADSGTLLAAAATEPETFTDVARATSDPAAILYTSGTTGRSKGAVLTHGNLLSNAQALAEIWRFVPDDVLVHALPVFHIHGLFVAINTVLAARASLVLLPRFEPAAVLAALREATVLMGVPTYYTRLLQEPGLDRVACAHMRLFVSGSAPLLAETHRLWRERTGHAILERYGMSETGMNASNPYAGERVPGSVGLPLPGVELRIADAASGAPVAAGETGVIEVRGPNVFAGYWRQPEKTRAEFRDDGFFITGDVGRIDERGYLWIVGRAKDLVISGGYNVYPREVEEAIDAIAGVEESAVIGLPHPDFGEGVTAVVVAPGRGAALDEAAVQRQLRERLAGYKIPKRVLFVAALPRNAMGKVQKNELRREYAGLYAAPDAPPAR
ncbi:MAG: malonyl-CoA synthase [Steroidobacteraceae bacterium]